MANFVELTATRIRKDPRRVRLNKGGAIYIPAEVYERLGSPEYVKVDYDLREHLLRFTPSSEGRRVLSYKGLRINTALHKIMPTGIYQQISDRVDRGLVFKFME